MANITSVENMQQDAMQPDTLILNQLNVYRDSIASALSNLALLDSMRMALTGTISRSEDSIRQEEIKDWLVHATIPDRLGTDSLLLQILIAHSDTTSIDTAAMSSLNKERTVISEFIAVQEYLADSLIAMIDSMRDTRVANMVDSNSAISTSVDIEQYYQQVYDIYLKTIAVDITQNTIVAAGTLFSTTQLATLYNLAFMCPMEGGEAVFRARAMLAMVIDTVYFDDVLCADHGESEMFHFPNNDSTQQSTDLKITLYPNPAKDYAILKLNQNISPLVLRITNVLGQIIMNGPIATTGGIFIINTSSVSDGLYNISLYNNNDKIFNDKLSIFR